jgi:DNA-binding transcriptional LysR family regulator
MIENRHLRYFVVLAKRLHMRQAAAELQIAQPTLTQNIQQLERDLGTLLLQRTGRKLSLTDAGVAFQIKAEGSLAQFEFAKEAARRAGRESAGQVIVGFTSSAGVRFIPQMLQKSYAMDPDVAIQLRELDMESQFSALRSGDIHVAIAYAAPSVEFESRELDPESLVIAVSTRHALPYEGTIGMTELADEPLILPSRSAAATLTDAILTECSSMGFRPRSTRETSTYQSALGLVSAGFGMAIMPDSVQVLQREGVTIRRIRSAGTKVRLLMLWKKNGVSSGVRHLLDTI